MSNLESKFKNWQEKMQRKTEKEKHVYALTVSFFVTAIIVFFVASSWYFRISGDSIDTSLLTEIESSIKKQLNSLENLKANFDETKTEFQEIINTGNVIIVNSTTTNVTTFDAATTPNIEIKQ